MKHLLKASVLWQLAEYVDNLADTLITVSNERTLRDGGIPKLRAQLLQ
jgi:hypothetical protein